MNLISGGGTLAYPNTSLVKETNELYLKGKPLYEYVDLGLPSGLKWAAWNVGATKPEEFGLYFCWGETEGYENVCEAKQFTAEEYKYTNDGGNTFTKYNSTDNLTTLELEDDAAYQSDNSCRMPTEEEYVELMNNTTITFEELNGVSGIKCTGTNGNYIFLPSSGSIYQSKLISVGEYSYLWTSTLVTRYDDSGRVFYMYHEDSSVDIEYQWRWLGSVIRPVKR